MATDATRRDFLKTGLAVTSLAAASSLSITTDALAAKSPNSKLGVAVVGAGGMGGYSVSMALRENLVALVDIDDNRVADVMKRISRNGKAKSPNVKTYFDYRKMLDQCHKDIDVVLVATPDHHHAPACIRAIRMGKAAFSQKPLAHNIAECYAMAAAAKKHKVLTQMGNQGHCSEHIRRVCEYIWAGAVGNVLEAHAILGRNFGGSDGRPKSEPAPKGVHWDEWIGPAPYRDYHKGLHPFSWRSWRKFGTGTIGDMACHNLDALFWALRLADAKQFTIECVSQTKGSDEKYPTDNVIRWEFPARGKMPPVKVFSYDHKKIRPDVMTETEKKHNRRFGEFTLFVGDKAMIGTDGRIIPEEKHKAFTPPPKTIPRAHGGPIEDLFYAIKNGGSPCSNFIDSAAPLTAFALTGHLAMFAGVGKKLQWDVEKMKVTNAPEINKYVGREYRKGWEI
ncbi:MAG: Gfo/Idh/MocA family oxidoreductase [Phycisphaerae bacterium]|jgi:predicted dehydrogenase|nr:Gfo/Idh/MocA family oxidoreductase [Phycisphaerae bacterium]